MRFKPTDERLSERHANRLSNYRERHICPEVRSLWLAGYTAHQIARMVRRPLVDVKLMTEMLPQQGRAEYNPNGGNRA